MITHVNPDRNIVRCPFCSKENEISDSGNIVCNHFVDFNKNGFIFDSQRVEMAQNTLHVVYSGVLETKSFFDRLIGKHLTFWIGHEPILFGIDMLTSVDYIEFSDILAIAFFGSNSEIKFAVGFGYGFGFKVADESDHYWVDNMNEKECMVIQYRKSE